MSESRQSWLKGDLPTWVALGLLSILTWFGKQYIDNLNRRLEANNLAIADVSKLLAEREPRFMALEVQNIFNSELIRELKVGQRELLSELREINFKLRLP